MKDDEPDLWIKQAEKDLKASKDSLNAGNYEWSCFQAHQAVEKALKAIYLKRYKELLKTHDLTLLASKINCPQNILNNCKELNSLYLTTRYPDNPSNYTKEEAKELITLTEEVLAWTKESL